MCISALRLCDEIFRALNMLDQHDYFKCLKIRQKSLYTVGLLALNNMSIESEISVSNSCLNSKLCQIQNVEQARHIIFLKKINDIYKILDLYRCLLIIRLPQHVEHASLHAQEESVESIVFPWSQTWYEYRWEYNGEFYKEWDYSYILMPFGLLHL